MAITFDCESCGGKMQAPEDLAGKRAKCPSCLAVVTVPGAMATIPESPAAAEGSEQRRPCPACGEMIIATAAKCRFCGEIFDPTLRRHVASPEVRKKFNQQMRALGALWIILASLGMCAAISLMSLGARIKERAEVDPEIMGVLMLFIVVLWFVAGIGTCAKQMWAVYLGLVLSYLNTLGSIVQIIMMAAKNPAFNPCGMIIGIAILIVGIVQGHRCIGYNNQLKRGSLMGVE